MPKRSTLADYSRIEFFVEEPDPDTGQLEARSCGKGVRTVIGGVEMEVFPVGVLCRAIGRSRATVLLWEDDTKPRTFFRPLEGHPFFEEMECEFAVLPKSTYTVPHSKMRRWYSRGQIELVRKTLIAHEAVIGRTKIDWYQIASDLEEGWNA